MKRIKKFNETVYLKDIQRTEEELLDLYYNKITRADAKIKESELFNLIPNSVVDEIFNTVLGEGWKIGHSKKRVSDDMLNKLKTSYINNHKYSIISRAYHMAKNDGSNQELVNAVEEYISR